MTTEPEVFQVTFLLPSGDQPTIPIAGEEHIWDAAFADGLTLPAMCHQGYCLTCAARSEDGGEIDQSDSLVYYPAVVKLVSFCFAPASPRANLRLRTHQQKEMREFRKQRKLIAPYSWTEE